MPARTRVLCGRRTSDAPRRVAQAGRGRDHGRDLFRNPAAHRAPRLRRVQRARSCAEAAAGAYCRADLGARAVVRIPFDEIGAGVGVMSDRSFDAIIIGGGCAGFAAATALADAGARVLVVEARPGLGGRATAFTDPATGERVDNGQHILMGCYTETLALLDRIGAADRVRWQTGLKLSMIDRRGHHSVLALPALPSPLHFLAGVLAWDALNWRERLSVLSIGASINPAKAGHHPTSLGISVRAWLEKN